MERVIFVVPVGVLTTTDHINLVKPARFINPFLMEQMICRKQGIFGIIFVCIGHLICTGRGGHLIHKMILPSTPRTAR